jgi:hypothetical protein
LYFFGGDHVSAIHGRLLTAWSTTGIVGPLIVNDVLDHLRRQPLAETTGLPADPAHHGWIFREER